MLKLDRFSSGGRAARSFSLCRFGENPENKQGIGVRTQD